MNPSRRSLIVFSAAAGAAAGLSSTASADDPVHSYLFRPRVDVCRQSLAGTPGSFSDAAVSDVLDVLSPVLVTDPPSDTLIPALAVVLEDAYPGLASLGVVGVTYQWVYDAGSGRWFKICTLNGQGVVNDDPSDPIVISVQAPMPVV